MAIVINKEPNAEIIVSTLIPIKFYCTEITANTTNLVAKCFYIDQTTAVETQIGGEYRLAPNLDNADNFEFDASEIFNTLTKYTLGDMPTVVMGEKINPLSDALVNWKDVATWYVNVKFYREYLDATSGLIVLDPTPEPSNKFFVHEGCPEQQWLTTVVDSNGVSNSTFRYFQANFVSGDRHKRFLTNYPIKNYFSYVDIGQNESYIINFFAPNQTYCGYKIQIKTYDSTDTALNTHEMLVAESNNLQTAFCGFRDIVSGLTANGAEGTDFVNVAWYYVAVWTGNVIAPTPCVYENALTKYKFTVNRACVGQGYLRFAFKNMLGGFDMVSSHGKFTKKNKSKFNQFEQSLGFDNWNDAMAFGNSNWANEQTVDYSVITQPMRREYGEHFAEMFNSTNVYLRVANNPELKVDSTNIDQSDFPYKFNPIVIKGGTAEIYQTTINFVKIKFSFSMGVNQRTPRY